MIIELEKSDYGRARGVFQGLVFHLALAAILGGSVPGRVFVDDASNPQAGLAWTKGRFHLAGSAGHEAFNSAAGRLFEGTIYPQARAAGKVAFSLFYDGEDWEPVITGQVLKDKHPLRANREYYTFKRLKHDWRVLLPAGYQVQFMDTQLLANRSLQNLERLESELCSERESVKAFLEKSFGACLIHDDTIAAWCLTEFNHGDRCEIGIETVETHQRRGFATLTASALIEHAKARGIRQIGWHCYANNVASGAAARKTGFEKDRDYPAYTAWFDEVDNLAANGNARLREGRYEEAQDWFEQAFARGEAKDWAYWGAARAAAALGQDEAALRYLGQAVDRGFRELALLIQAEDFKRLYGSRSWEALIAQLENRLGERP